MQSKIISIAYFSGTGSTEMVAGCFEKAFVKAGYDVNMHRIFRNIENENAKHNLLLLAYPVHALNAPAAVYDWIKRMDNVKDVPAIVVSVSGGGEVSPNTACRVSTIKRLEKKGFKVIYEKMLVMPSNCLIHTANPLDAMLLEVLPKKVEAIVNDVENGVIKRSRPLFIDRLLAYMGETEKFGVKILGKMIKSTDTCNGCGRCSSNCPVGNINMVHDKPRFGYRCNFCLSCIYGCPKRALVPRIGKFFIFKDGYNIKKFEKMLPINEQVDVEKLAKGYAWSGVKKYLQER